MSWTNKTERNKAENYVVNPNIEKVERIDETQINCPASSKAVQVMCSWGSKKRQSYAQLVEEGFAKHEAFYFVEYNNGEEI